MNPARVRPFLIGPAAVLVFLGMTAEAGAVDVNNALSKIRAYYEKVDRDVYDLMATQEVEGSDGTRTLQRIYQRGEKIRIDTDNPSTELAATSEEAARRRGTVIYDGYQAWSVTSIGSQPVPVPIWVEGAMYSRWWRSVSDGAAVVDQARLGTADCFVIRLEASPAGGYSKLWVEKDTLGLVRAEGSSEDGRQRALEFSDLRDAGGGWKVARHVDYFENGVLSRRIAVKSVKLNRDLPDEIFHIPEPRLKSPEVKPSA